MSANNEWINELKGRIIEDDDKVIFEETAGCYTSGHYRAAYIMAWISLVESLKRKIYVLESLGDARAANAKQLIDKAEGEKKSVDGLIYEESKTCGIIDNTEHSKVNFLWEQRCLFAHPYNLQPEEDEVKHIIGQSVRISLGKELHFTKDYLKQLAINISTKPYFLPKDEERVRSYASHSIARIMADLHPFFFKTLLFEVGKVCHEETKRSELFKLRYFIVELFTTVGIDLENSDWSLEHRVTNYPYDCYVGIVQYETWGLFPERIKEMLIAYMESETNGEKLLGLKSITVHLVSNSVLEDRFKNRFHKKLNSLSFNSSINFYGEPKAQFDRICLDMLTWKYNEQNPVVDHLRTDNALELINGLDKDKQQRLGRIIKAAARNGHYKSQALEGAIIEGEIAFAENVKSGIAVGGMSTMRGEFSLDRTAFISLPAILNDLSEAVQNESYQFIEKLIDEKHVTRFDKLVFTNNKFTETADSALASLDGEWNPNNKKGLESLIDKIKSHFSASVP